MNLLIDKNETLGDFRIYRSAHFEQTVIIVECDGFWDVLRWNTTFEKFMRYNKRTRAFDVAYDWHEDNVTYLWRPGSKSTMYRNLHAVLTENGVV